MDLLNVSIVEENKIFFTLRRVIFEKHCEFEINKKIYFIRQLKNTLVKSQKYEEAAKLRDLEKYIYMDYSLAEEYIILLKKKQKQKNG